METGKYVSRLNEHAQKGRLELKYEEVGSVGPDHIKTFTVRAVLDGKAYPDGVGKNKKEAKHNAAKNALKGLGELVDSTGVDNNIVASSQLVEELNQNVSDICDKRKSLTVTTKGQRFIGLVNHYCQKTKLSHDYIQVKRCGPPHDPQFFYKLVINNKEYPVGEGKSIKDARQNAAQLAWSALQEQSDWDSKVSVRSTVSEDGARPVFSEPSTSLESHDSSSQSTSVSTCGSIITCPSNPSKAQMPFRSAASGDNAPTSLEFLASSQNMSTGTSGSEILTDSSNSSKDQHVVEDRNTGNSHNEAQSAQSRFTSEFDSIKRLGKGSFGRVFKAKEKLTEKYYAIKIIHCKDIKKALREVGALSDLHHCNIVRYYTCWLDDSGYQGDSTDGSCSSSQSTDNSSAKYLHIKLELCDTKTLKVWINEKNTQSLQDSKRGEESLSIAQQIVSGVEYIHSKMLIHRDLKPANILFGLDEVVKIGDFGLVTRDDDVLTDRTVNKGTPIYRAPEQVDYTFMSTTLDNAPGLPEAQPHVSLLLAVRAVKSKSLYQKSEKNYDRKVDIFPLGLIYFELLWKLSTGHERGEKYQVLGDARNRKLPAGFSLTFPRENQIIQSMLCEKPEGRPEARTLKAELETLAQALTAQNTRQENEICLL